MSQKDQKSKDSAGSNFVKDPVYESREATFRPSTASDGCWVQIFESGNFKDRSLKVWGPASYSNLRGLPDSGGFDWGDQIDSLIMGPKCWLQAFEDEDFKDSEIWFVPNQIVASLDELNFGDDIDSMRVYDHPPTRFFKWLTKQPRNKYTR